MKTLYRLLITLLMLLVMSCSEEKTTEVTVQDTNADQVFNISPHSGLIGNVDLHLIPDTIQGSAIVIINGPGNAIGYDIRDVEDQAFIYFADSYIAAGGNSLQSGTILPTNKWVKIRLVLYESGLAGWVVSFLQYLGLDFFESLENYMIDEVYEIEVLLEDRGGEKGILKGVWKKII
jgi:hypothetical protein